jgi:arsenate reductase
MCTGNSCRSQMAEAIVNKKLSEKWEAFSAGSHPAGYVHPMAIQSLAEIGIEFRGQAFDLVFTLCDTAEDECPVWLGKGRQIHLPFPDPAKTVGNAAEKLAAFREVRDAISNKLIDILDQ